jgi:predicted RNase H-like nuclease
MKLAGIDLAWNIEKNNSAMAIGELSEKELSISALFSNLKGTDQIISEIDDDIRGVAIDAPLIIKNKSGQRQCERELGRAYGHKGAGCHTANLERFPDSMTVKFSSQLQGFKHRGNPDEDKFQIEVYPHPAIIEMFGLSKRLLYKRGGVTVRREGQIALANHIRSLKNSKFLKLNIEDSIQHQLKADYIFSLNGQSLKTNEDALDSIICLYVCALYVKDESRRENTFGTVDDGYIYVPRDDCRP